MKGVREQISKLARGQNPHTLFLTCSDSRIDLALFTQTKPGELFVIRNVGNIIPPFEEEDASITAALEFATQVLGIKNIVVCGHSNCGALVPNPPPHVCEWVKFAGDTIKSNIVKQLEHLRTYPFLEGVGCYGWLFNIDEAAVYVYDPVKQQFSIIQE